MKRISSIQASAARVWSSPWLRIVVGGIVSVVFLSLAFRAVPPGQMLATLGQVRPLFVGLTLLSIALNIVAKAVRWRVLLGAPGAHIRWLDVLGALLIGQVLNTFIPTRVGDLSRAYTIGQRGPGTGFVLGTVVLEKLLDTVAFGALVLCAVFLAPLPPSMMRSAYQVFLVGVLVLGGALLAYRRQLPQWGAARLRRYAHHRVAAKVINGARAAWASADVLGRPWEVAKLVALTASVWGTAILNNYLMLRAFDLDLALGAAVLILVGLQLGISLPSLPGTIGVFEYVCVVVLALFGVERTLAFSYGVLLHAVVLIPPTIVGLLFLVVMRSATRPPSVPHHANERPG